MIEKVICLFFQNSSLNSFNIFFEKEIIKDKV